MVSLIISLLLLLNQTLYAYTTKLTQAGVNAGTKTLITGGEFKDNLINEAGSVAFNAVGHDLYNNSEYKEILPPKSVVQGLVGGALAELQGGDFTSGAISTATSHIVAENMLQFYEQDIKDGKIGLKELETFIKATSSVVSGVVTKAVNPDVSDEDLKKSNDIGQNAVEHNAIFLIPVALAILEGIDKGITAYDAYQLAKAVDEGDSTKVEELTTTLAIGMATDALPANKVIQKIYGSLSKTMGKKADDVLEVIEDGKVIHVDSKGNTLVGDWSTTKILSAPENASEHWARHGAEFPDLSNATQYVEVAQKFVTNPPSSVLTKTRSNGDTVLYDPVSNVFAVKNSAGSPRTMFKPDPDAHGYSTNLEYFNAQ